MALVYFANVIVVWFGTFILARMLGLRSPAVKSLVIGLVFGAVVVAGYWFLIN